MDSKRDHVFGQVKDALLEVLEDDSLQSAINHEVLTFWGVDPMAWGVFYNVNSSRLFMDWNE